jgi:RNA polymerase primary sigma factor
VADHGRTIRLPVAVAAKLSAVRRVQIQLTQTLGRDPTPAEIAVEVGCEPEVVRDLLRSAADPISLQTPIGEAQDGFFADILEDSAAECPFEAASDRLRRESVVRALRRLPERERVVMEMRYGLANCSAKSRQEVGRVLDLSSERLRQIEKATLETLEALPEVQHLRECV